MVTHEQKVAYIRKKTPIADRYEQLAEELIEAAHAAMKIARLTRGVSPSPINLHEAELRFCDEYGDVLAVLDVEGFDDATSIGCANYKVDRWYNRLLKAEGKNDDNG